jgi:hypothetical protein
MPDSLALTVVLLTGAYFVGLGVASLATPRAAGRFLLGFAGSAGAHYIELLLRLFVGAAFVVHAPAVPWPAVFTLFGWGLVLTTICLCAVPWRWHRRFAERTVPQALHHLPLLGVASLALGAFVLGSTFAGP